ncbi:MAG: hybrid sensor histidine kinase/response regulator transcription factor [Phocaeicola sp.]
MKQTRTIVCLLLLWVVQLTMAQASKLFTTDRELSSSLINCLYQDRNGMIWIGTEDGLNRYDGVKFTIYKHEKGNEHSLRHNLIRSIYEDKQGNLLIGTYRGIQKYDTASDCFSELAVKEDGSIFNSNVNMIVQRKNGEIWLSGNELSTLSMEQNKLIVKPIELPTPNRVTDYLMEDRNGNMWIVMNENRIYKLNKKEEMKYYPLQEENTLVTTLTQDANGEIYAGTIGNGLFKLDAQQEQFLPLPNTQTYNLPIKAIYHVNNDEIYIGSDGKGLKKYNTRTQQLTDSRFENNSIDLTSAKVHSVLKDNNGNFWISIYQKGVLMIPAQLNNFKYIGPKSINTNSIGSYYVTTLYKDANDVMWVGTDNDGVYGITQTGKQLAHFAPSNSPSSISPIIITLFEDSKKNLWFGSFRDGLGKIDRKTGQCHYLKELVDEEGNAIHRVYALAEDSQKQLFIGTMGNGLYSYQLESNEIKQIEAVEDLRWITSMHYAPTNKLYVGTYNSLLCLDLSSTPYNITRVLENHIVHSLFEDKDGVVWAATSDGLARWNVESHQVTKYTSQDGLPSDVVYSIQQDVSGNYWIATDAGLSQFIPHRNHFINFFVGDGLQGNEFSKNASFKEENGTLWFAGVNGITYFNPQEIVNPAKRWNVRITDFYLHNKPVRKSIDAAQKSIIEEAVFNASEFQLSHKENAFSIEFSTTEFNSPERISYQYAMNDTNWIELRPGINRVSFDNLLPGTYQFHVRAKDYTITSDIKTIKIVISPPWYSSIWAKTGYFLLFILACYLVIQRFIERYETKQQMLKYQHAEEINEAKLQFFINISHEIRTPMSLVISPLQRLMKLDQEKERHQLYQTMWRNAERILSLVNQLMDIRKIDKGQMRLTFQKRNITEFVYDLVETFQYQVKIKKIRLNYLPSSNEIEGWIDPSNFDKIILNILSNAFKFTPPNGEINLTVTTAEDTNLAKPLQKYIEVAISDSGVGIAEEEIERIFDRFYQIGDNQPQTQVGTGIGLHLTRLLVGLHYGTIQVTNNPNGEGCRFVVRIPLGCDHLNEQEMVVTPYPPMQEKEEEEENAIVEQAELATELENEQENKSGEKRGRCKTKYRILLVEDDEDIRHYLRSELESEYHIAECSNGKEALSLLLKRAPDLVISDVMMPEMDGTTLCQKIKHHVNINHLPVILLTAKSEEEEKLVGLNVGADAYLTKPFNIEVVRHTAQNLIKSRELLRNCFSGNQEQESPKPALEIHSTNNKLLDRIMNVINRNLSNPELNVEMITQEVGISRVHLHRKLKELTNQSTRDLIRNVRLKHAAYLLKNSDYNISEITDFVGFSSLTLFSRSFKEFYGVTPSEYGASKREKEQVG